MLKLHKVVSALPGTLESDSIYFVRAGAGFDLYVTNGVGQIVAYALNGSSSLPAILQSMADLSPAADRVYGLDGNSQPFLFQMNSIMRGLMASATVAALKTSMSINNVDNTSDASKPISTAQQTELNLKATKSELTSGTITESTFTGTRIGRALTYNANQSSVAATKYTAQKVTAKFAGTGVISVGGFINCLQTEAVLNSSSSTNKLVGYQSLLSNTGGGRCDVGVGVESTFLSLDATSKFTQANLFHVPDLSGISNIANAEILRAFNNDHLGADIRSRGRFMKVVDRTLDTAAATSREIAPARHPGYVTGRCYGPSMVHSPGTNNLQSGYIYGATFDCAERTTFTAMGIRVLSGAAGVTGRFCIYLLEGGLPTKLIYGSGTVSLGSPGAAEATGVNTILEAGTYYVGIAVSATVALGTVTSVEARRLWGRSSGTVDDYSPLLPFTYGAFPATWSGSPSYSDLGGLSPDIYLRK